MVQLDYLRQLLAESTVKVGSTVPPSRKQVLSALMSASDTMPLTRGAVPSVRPGWKLALRLVLERHDKDVDPPADGPVPAAWVERYLHECDQLALASVALERCQSGVLQLQQRAPDTFVAWRKSRHLSTEERESLDFDWWTEHLAREVAPRLAALIAGRPRMPPEPGQRGTADSEVERYYHELGKAHVTRLACQHSYPAEAALGGMTFSQYTDVLALLIGWLYRERDLSVPIGHSMPWDERDLAAALAEVLDADPAVMGRALQPFILDRDNAAYHSALQGRAAPPLIRLDERRVVLSPLGLLSEPLVFLTRELRRRHPEQYHNSARLREGVFRRDLYRLFSDARFALSSGRVELKRTGDVRTDLDALIFDRKTGTLGIFELKAQDPFVRSVEERRRQRDNFYHANRQVSATLEWVQCHGADDLLARFDERTAKRFRVQKVYVFVLGRYLAEFAGGPEPDRRAAWGSWPEVLRAFTDGAFGTDSRNPLGKLFSSLRNAAPPSAPVSVDSQVIEVADFRLRIFPSFADVRKELEGL
ncbi:MAG: hypothetical protein M3281_02485 [Chloroflexota bacterium]|nr:hypothetical protein [Chloroflexota bacterium]